MPKITLYYDGECPICNQFKLYIDLRKKFDVELKNAREYREMMVQYQKEGMDISKGMILILDNEKYHGKHAFMKLYSICDNPFPLNIIYGVVSKSHILSSISYSILTCIRRILLKWKGISPDF